MWRHPKYYKELRERNKSDQVISNAEATAASERAPGQGQSLTRDSNADGGEGSSSKHQASSAKQQASSKPEPVQVQEASSAKRQASSPE